MQSNFCLSKRKFYALRLSFKALEIDQKDAVGKNYEQLCTLIKSQYHKVALKKHTDKTQAKSHAEIATVNASRTKLIKHIENLQSGNLVMGTFTLYEFQYRKKLFDDLGLSADEVVDKTWNDVFTVFLKKKFEEQKFIEFIDKFTQCCSLITEICQESNDDSNLFIEFKKNFLELQEMLGIDVKSRSIFSSLLKSSDAQLFFYSLPLLRDFDPVEADKKFIGALCYL
jgi:hypothetical protein